MENPLADIERIEAITDPAERAREIGRILKALPAAAAELKTMRQRAVQELREQKLSYAAIGALLGVHRNRAEQIGNGR
jgi:hypothetical protein